MSFLFLDKIISGSSLSKEFRLGCYISPRISDDELLKCLKANTYC